MKRKINIQFKLIVILVLLLATSIGYIINTEINVYRQGVDFGVKQTLFQIVQEVGQCKQIPLAVGDQTINLVALECIERLQSEGS